MKVIPLTQGQATIVDNEDYERVMKYKWHLQSNRRHNYATRMDGKKKVYLHRFILDAPRGLEVDHKNHNGLDNRRENLRLCTHPDNLRNRGATQSNTSGYKGVTFIKRHWQLQKPWSAHIMVNGKNLYLGYFATREDAAQAYDHAVKVYHGQFAVYNFLDTKGG